MSTKQSVGVAPSNAKDKVTVGYVSSQIAATNMAQGTIDSLIAAGFASYVDLSYVNTQSALNATHAYVDGTGGANPNGGDGGRLHLSQKNQPSGVAALGSVSAKVDRSRLGLSSTQRFPTPYSSPSTYNASPVTSVLVEETVYSWTFANPGYTYKLMVNGIVDGAITRDGYFPIVLIRAGSNTGNVIAVGFGCAEFYSAAAVSAYGPGVSFIYNIPVWATNIDILVLGGAGGGASGNGAVLIWGDGGLAGVWAAVNVVVGSGALPSGVTTISGVVGVGGAGGRGSVFSNPGAGGTATSVTYYHSSITGAGGAGGHGVEGTQAGQNSGFGSIGGNLYSNQGFGCGGAGGAGGFFIGNHGQPGTGGLALIVAHPLTTDYNSGPVNVVPGALSEQSALTGDTPLFVQLLRAVGDNTTNGTASAGLFENSMYAMSIPA